MGRVVKQDRDDNRDLYGRKITAREILIDGIVAVPPAGRALGPSTDEILPQGWTFVRKLVGAVEDLKAGAVREPPLRLMGANDLSLREAPGSAVAAATAFRLCFLTQSRNPQNEKGGSRCYRTPRSASPA